MLNALGFALVESSALSVGCLPRRLLAKTFGVALVNRANGMSDMAGYAAGWRSSAAEAAEIQGG
jgi:hypothetical protein